jgi:DNA-binding MarR family transcriptional regulator
MKRQRISAKDAPATQVANSSRLINYYWQQLMSRNGMQISTRQWVALDELYHKGEMFQKDFVNETYDDRPTVANMISSLVKKGLIIKEPDSIDRRNYRIRLTPEGEDVQHKLSSIIKSGRKKMHKGLNRSDFIELKRILGTLNKNILEG